MAKVHTGPGPEPNYNIDSSKLDPLPDVAWAPDWMKDAHQVQKMTMLGALAGGIAHDFNNILTAIQHTTERIQPALAQGHPIQPLLETIQSAIHRGAQLNRQILTFSRREATARVRFDMSILVKEAVQLLHAALPDNVKINDEIEASIWILGDPNQIHQVFMNLAINAHHAMAPQGGLLGISIHPVCLENPQQELSAGRYAVLEVNDTGCGMKPEVLREIFAPFFTTKANPEATGLGLAITKEIIHKHGGTIQVASEPGKGSAFRVLLPMVSSEGQAWALEDGP
ncbi:MAG: ATP-binding protein [Holophaga sp.]|nr:ATP-binding protein [Holophaga sp.]